MKHRVPTADHIAAAIVAACRATGEDPEACVRGEVPDMEARHYALHGLLAVFLGEIAGSEAARFVGAARFAVREAAQAGRRFFTDSLHNAVDSSWWQPAILNGVIEAIRAVDRRPEPAGAIDPVGPAVVRVEAPASVRAPERPPARPARVSVAEPAPRSRAEPAPKRGLHPLPTGGKADLNALLRQAVENTAAMTPRDE